MADEPVTDTLGDMRVALSVLTKLLHEPDWCRMDTIYLALDTACNLTEEEAALCMRLWERESNA